MSALTTPSRVPIHSLYIGTFSRTMSATSTVGGGGGLAADVASEQPTAASKIRSTRHAPVQLSIPGDAASFFGATVISLFPPERILFLAVLFRKCLSPPDRDVCSTHAAIQEWPAK